MSDEQQWQAPSPPVGPPQLPPSPPGGMSVPPTPPTAGSNGAGFAPGWTPPPKPGLVPLRPMTLGTILGASFQVLRRNPGATLAPALILSVIVAVLQALGSAGFLTQYLGAVSDLGSSASSTSASSITSLTSGLLGFVLAALLAGVLQLFVSAIIEAIVTVQVSSGALGVRLRLGTVWRRLSGRRGAVIGWAALSGLAALLAIGVVTGLLILIAMTGVAGVVIALLLGFLVGAGLLVVSVWLWVKLGFVPAAIVLERRSILASMKRSWSLTRGAFWRTFGIRLLVVAMVSIASSIVTTPISLVFTLGSTVLEPNGATAAGATNALVLSTIITQSITAIVTGVGLVITSATTALLYLDRRMRSEALDIDLARYVERREAGEPELRDPYQPEAG